MKKTQRVKEILIGMFMILCSMLLILVPEEGYYIITFFFSISLIVSGIRYLFYYFSMAKNMVGGKAVFYKGLIILDLGMFTITMIDIPLLYIMLYLLVCYAFAGIIDIMKAMEAKRIHAPSWKWEMLYGLLELAAAFLALFCGMWLKSVKMIVYIYCAGLFYAACVRIAAAFRKTAIIYIQ